MTEQPKQTFAFHDDTKWVDVKIGAIDFKTLDGNRIVIPDHTVRVPTRYPISYSGDVRDYYITHATAIESIRTYNRDNGAGLTLLPLYADEAIRDQLGSGHTMFDEDFERDNLMMRWGYLADFTKPASGINERVEGIDGRKMCTRVLGYRLPDGDVELGVIRMARRGMVPTLTRERLEKKIGAVGLKRLEELRGREIYEKRDDIVDVRNALGYPQFTLPDDSGDEHGLVPHSHHFCEPFYGRDEEIVGIRGANHYHNGRRCFHVLLIHPPDSEERERDTSFQLAYKSGVEGNVVRPDVKLQL